MFALGLAFGVALGVVGAPLWRTVVMAVSAERYESLVYRCDSAMRTHYVERARTAQAPSEEAVDQLRAAEIALIDCQDYDIYQKNLVFWGLRENELALMRLRAIESGGGTLDEVVRFHEIRD